MASQWCEAGRHDVCRCGKQGRVLLQQPNDKCRCGEEWVRAAVADKGRCRCGRERPLWQAEAPTHCFCTALGLQRGPRGSACELLELRPWACNVGPGGNTCGPWPRTPGVIVTHRWTPGVVSRAVGGSRGRRRWGGSRGSAAAAAGRRPLGARRCRAHPRPPGGRCCPCPPTPGACAWQTAAAA